MSQNKCLHLGNDSNSLQNPFILFVQQNQITFSTSCSAGECIPSWKLCDGECDCNNKRQEVCEDETSFMCFEAQFDVRTFPKGYLTSPSKALAVQMGLVILMAVVCLIMYFMI